MRKSEFHVPRMDCSAEERLVRLQLEPRPGVHGLRFDLPARRVEVVHDLPVEEVRVTLAGMGLGGVTVVRDAEAGTEAEGAAPPEAASERGPLRAALAINASLFLAELLAGILAYSLGLIGDSLDMLADAVVYALALAAVGGSAGRRAAIARTTGYFQIFLACAGLAEVLRRALGGEGLPDFRVMIAVSLIALAGNVATLLLLHPKRGAGVHMQAAWICTSVDVQVNALVIASAGAVWLTGSRHPDLAVGALIFLLVANGARRILALAR